jgi:molybdopterin/thiamine biosynthesis adenylyltransferase
MKKGRSSPLTTHRPCKLSKKDFLKEMQSRHESSFGQEGCHKLSQAVVVVAGNGGVGCPVIEILARAGVGRFRLIDPDVFDLSNLNRQTFATIETIGQPKSNVAAKRIKEINPYAQIEKLFVEYANVKNVEELVEGADIVVEATTSRSSKYLFHDIAHKKHVPIVEGVAAFMGGQAWLTDYSNPKQKKISLPTGIPIINRLYYILVGQKKVENEQEIMALDEYRSPLSKDLAPQSIGFAVHIAASFVAGLAIKHLIGQSGGKTIRFPKRQIYFDLFNMKIRTSSRFSVLLKMLFQHVKRKFSLGQNKGQKE